MRAGIRCEGMGGPSMALTAVRAFVVGDIGVMVSITWRPDARGGIPRGGNRGPPPQERGKARKPAYPAISKETPVSAKKAKHLDRGGQEPIRGVFFYHIGRGGPLLCRRGG